MGGFAKISLEYRDQFTVTNSKGKSFIYETGSKKYQRKVKYSENAFYTKRKDDTRSLYDDPKLQKMRKLQTQKLIEKAFKNPQQQWVQSDELMKWIPLDE